MALAPGGRRAGPTRPSRGSRLSAHLQSGGRSIEPAGPRARKVELHTAGEQEYVAWSIAWRRRRINRHGSIRLLAFLRFFFFLPRALLLFSFFFVVVAVCLQIVHVMHHALFL